MDRDVSAQRAHAGAGGGHRSGALLAVDGQYLYVGEFGHLFWLGLTPQGYAETSRAWLFAARESWTLPVLSRGLLYVRQNTRDLLPDYPPGCSATTSGAAGRPHPDPARDLSAHMHSPQPARCQV